MSAPRVTLRVGGGTGARDPQVVRALRVLVTASPVDSCAPPLTEESTSCPNLNDLAPGSPG